MQHLQTHSLNGIFLCGFFWSSTHKSFQPPDVVFCCLRASRGINTGCIPSLEASPKEVLLKYIITLEPKVRSQEIESLTSKGSTFYYISASDNPWVTCSTKESEEMEVAVLLGVSKVYLRFTDMEIEGVSVCLSASARKNEWHFSIACTRCWNVVPVYILYTV